MSIWTDQERIRGIAVKATFFDGEAARKADTHAGRALPFLIGATPKAMTAGQEIHYGDLSAEPDAVFEHGDGLIIVQLANSASPHTPENWRQLIDLQDMLECVIAGYVLAQKTKRVTACVLCYQHAAFLLTPSQPVMRRLLGMVPMAKREHDVLRRLSAPLLADFAGAALLAAATATAFNAFDDDDDDDFPRTRGMFSDDDHLATSTSRSMFDDDGMSSTSSMGIGVGIGSGCDIGIGSAMGGGINPASGLPMVDSFFDVAGNAFGTSSDTFSSTGSDSFGSSSFGSGSAFD